MVEFDRFERLAMEDPELADFIGNLAVEDSCEELSSAVTREFGVEPLIVVGAATPIVTYIIWRWAEIGFDLIRGLKDSHLDRLKLDLIVDACKELNAPEKSVGRIAETFCKHVCSHSNDDPILKGVLGVMKRASESGNSAT